MNDKIRVLLKRGVRIPCPHSVEIGEKVNPESISSRNVTIHSGSKIDGEKTLVGAGTVIGEEAPATVIDCQLGPEVRLKGGYFKEAVFLKGAEMASGAHVRGGTILEEKASGAHTVALKQTILFPFVTLGSLINFCDCLMAGGTGPKNHSEVGSSYIHFNFTPNQDKATPSLLGDVPRGVMLNQKPIFLGGQGGLAGPCRINFGNIIAAGCIYRKDFLKEGCLLFDNKPRGGYIPFPTGLYRSVKRIVYNNIYYIANLIALKMWYQAVRSHFVDIDFPEQLQEALIQKVRMGLNERITRLEQLAQKMPASIALYRQNSGEGTPQRIIEQKEALFGNYASLESMLLRQMERDGSDEVPVSFLAAIESGIHSWGKDYITVIQNLDAQATHTGTTWLQAVVDRVVKASYERISALA